MYNKSNSASRGAALCRSATASLHFESQAKFKGEKPWRQTLTSNDRTARVDRRSVNLFNPDESKNAAPSPMGVCPLQSLAHGLSVCTSEPLALSSLGLDGATAHFIQSLRCPQNQRHRSQVAGKRAANCGRCGGGGPDPPLLRCFGALTNIGCSGCRLQQQIDGFGRFRDLTA